METLTRLDPKLKQLVLRRLVQVGLFILVQAAVLLLSSGRSDWVAAWVYVGLNVVAIAINAAILLPRNPELIAERAQIKVGAKAWDIVLVSLFYLLGLVMLTIAGLDRRFGWSASSAVAVQCAALGCMVLGYGLGSWAMATNKYFSAIVRIQKDRGHTVVTTGPYRYLRHPAYIGGILFALATPLLLGSLWALIPAGLTVITLVVRTALEDRTLQEELDGYKEYAGRVRYRLLPGVW